ncbi:hypothetical protein UlMin_010880 [Ulmus minor]
MTQGIFELMWLKILLKELQVTTSEIMKLYYDNKTVINIAHNPVHHDKTKHVEIDRHFIKEKIESGEICIPLVTSGNQLANVLTKGLTQPINILQKSILTKRHFNIHKEEQTFQRLRDNNQKLKQLQLQTTKKNSMSMIDFIMKIKGFCDSLAAIGESVSEQDQIMNLLAGLGSDYNAVVTSISARDSQLSLESVHSLLLTFEHRLEQQNSFDDTGVQLEETTPILPNLNVNFVVNLDILFKIVIIVLILLFRLNNLLRTLKLRTNVSNVGATHHMTQNAFLNGDLDETVYIHTKIMPIDGSCPTHLDDLEASPAVIIEP